MVLLHPIVAQLGLSRPQQEAASSTGRAGVDIAVTAGAGTGKTRTLVGRYLSLLAAGVPLRQIVAITFTRKAAREMRNRVRWEMEAFLERIGPDAPERKEWEGHASALDAARIGTIHNFCGEILRAYPAEAAVDPRFGVLDEGQSNLRQQEAVEQALAWAANDAAAVRLFRLLPESSLRQVAGELLAKRLDVAAALAGLPDEIIPYWQGVLGQRQQAALGALLAEPAWQEGVAVLRSEAPADPQDLMAAQRAMVLAAVAAAGREPDVTRQLEALAVLGQIKLTGGRAAGWPGGKEQLAGIKEALRGIRELWQSQPLLHLRLNEVDEAMAAAVPLLHALYRRMADNYQALKAQRFALDFDDLEEKAIRLLEEHPAVCRRWSEQIAAVLVDEFQDTNERQRRLVRLLCPDAGKLFIVGDAKQSIYRFRGADVSVFHQERAQIEAAGGLVRRLDDCYRSHQRLVEGVNGLMRPILGEASPQPWVAPFEPLAPIRSEARYKLAAPYIELHLAVGRKEQAMPVAARAIIGRLAALVAGGSVVYGDVAILCRAAGSFRFYENALDEAGIPYLTVAGKGFYDRPEIRDVLNALRALADPGDDLALAGLLRSPACGLSDRGLYQLVQARPVGASLWETLQGNVPFQGEDAACFPQIVALIGDLHRQAGRLPVADLLKQFLDKTGYLGALRQAGLERAARNLAKLLADAHQSGLVNAVDFLEYVASLKESGAREGEARSTAEGVVQIMSVHVAKGLEFPIVVLGDVNYEANHSAGMILDRELGPLLKVGEGKAAVYALAEQQQKAQEEAESNRLLYVAATRAQEMLLLNGCLAQVTQEGRPGGLKGWLKKIAGPMELADLSLSDFQEEGERSHYFDLQVGSTPVALMVYEPAYLPSSSPAMASGAATVSVTLPPPLLTSFAPAVIAADRVVAGETMPRVWQVVPSELRPAVPPWLPGTLVHEALAVWRFPGEGFDGWVTARAHQYGLIDGAQIGRLAGEVAALLNRWRAHPLCAEIETAERRLHELPYSLKHNGQVEQGTIDLLYRRNGQWVVVDFKTDRVSQVNIGEVLAKTDYVAQVQRYGAAVQELLGELPSLALCFLNCDGGIYVERALTSIAEPG